MGIHQESTIRSIDTGHQVHRPSNGSHTKQKKYRREFGCVQQHCTSCNTALSSQNAVHTSPALPLQGCLQSRLVITACCERA